MLKDGVHIASIANETTSMALGKKRSRNVAGMRVLHAFSHSWELVLSLAIYTFGFVFSIASNRCVSVHCCTFNKRINFPEMRCISFLVHFGCMWNHRERTIKSVITPGQLLSWKKISFRWFIFLNILLCIPSPLVLSVAHVISIALSLSISVSVDSLHFTNIIGFIFFCCFSGYAKKSVSLGCLSAQPHNLTCSMLIADREDSVN